MILEPFKQQGQLDIHMYNVETCAHEQCCCLNGQKHQKENFGFENFAKLSHDVQTVQTELN